MKWSPFLAILFLAPGLAQKPKEPKPITPSQNEAYKLATKVNVDGQWIGVYLPKQGPYTILNSGRGSWERTNTSTKIWVDQNNNGQVDDCEARRSSLPLRIGDTMYEVASIAPDGSSVKLAPSKSRLESIVIGRKAPVFVFTDIRGEEVSNMESAGRWLVLHVLSYTCHACTIQWSGLKNLQREIGDKKLDVLLLFVDRTMSPTDPTDAIRVEIESKGAPWQAVVLPDGWSTVTEAFNTEAYGLTLIDPKGIVRGVNLTSKDVASLIK